MKPDTHTVQQLFERDVRYTVPLYQRPYVWDEDHQWAPLWDDITALLEHQERLCGRTACTVRWGPSREETSDSRLGRATPGDSRLPDQPRSAVSPRPTDPSG